MVTAKKADRVRRWSKRRQPRLLFKRRRWESNPLKSCFAGSRRTVWLQRQLSVLARNRTWTSTFAGLHAHPAHPEDENLAAARRGVEPRLAVSRTAVRSGTLAGCVNQYPDLDLNQGLDLRRVQCKSATPSGQTEPTTGFAPASAGLQNRCLSQSSHVGKSTGARSRTLSGGFGGDLLSREHTGKAFHGHGARGANSLVQFHVPIRFADEAGPTVDPHVAGRVQRPPHRPDRLGAPEGRPPSLGGAVRGCVRGE